MKAQGNPEKRRAGAVLKGEEGLKKVCRAISETNGDFIGGIPPDGFDSEEIELYGTRERMISSRRR